MYVCSSRIMYVCNKLFQYHLLHKTFTKLVNQFSGQSEKHLESLRKMALEKCRPNPIIMKLDTPEFNSLFTSELTTLASLFKQYGYELRIAGGAVRDLLMGKTPKDLDFATTATPDKMKEMFNTENVRMINTKGEKHGTITPRINNKENFEITTLRVDLRTDGRHAEVQFTTDWLLDANRRDLTINSMFLGLDGSVYDYFYGYEDLQKHRIAFVGDATTRMREDYLRILRYFRFYGRIAKDKDSHEEPTLNAIRDNVQGLQHISGERIWVELKQILEGNFAGDLMLKILDVGCAPYIGLPETPNCEELKRVWENGKNSKLQGITLLSSLLRDTDDALNLHSRLKLSAYERDLALFIVQNRNPKPHPKPLFPYQQMLARTSAKPSDFREWIIELLKYNNFPFIHEFENWTLPKFPVTGNMLKQNGIESGRFMGLVMSELRNCWADNDFKMTEDELLLKVPHIVSLLEKRKKQKKS